MAAFYVWNLELSEKLQPIHQGLIGDSVWGRGFPKKTAIPVENLCNSYANTRHQDQFTHQAPSPPISFQVLLKRCRVQVFSSLTSEPLEWTIAPSGIVSKWHPGHFILKKGIWAGTG